MSPLPTDEVLMHEIHLEVVKFYLDQAVTPIQLQRMKLERLEDFLGQSFRFRLSYQMAGRQGEALKYPADWWQAVRERFAPRWWLKRHPVHYFTRTAYEMLPAVPLPDSARLNAFPMWRNP